MLMAPARLRSSPARHHLVIGDIFVLIKIGTGSDRLLCTRFDYGLLRADKLGGELGRELGGLTVIAVALVVYIARDTAALVHLLWLRGYSRSKVCDSVLLHTFRLLLLAELGGMSTTGTLALRKDEFRVILGPEKISEAR